MSAALMSIDRADKVQEATATWCSLLCLISSWQLVKTMHVEVVQSTKLLAGWIWFNTLSEVVQLCNYRCLLLLACSTTVVMNDMYEELGTHPDSSFTEGHICTGRIVNNPAVPESL